MNNIPSSSSGVPRHAGAMRNIASNPLRGEQRGTMNRAAVERARAVIDRSYARRLTVHALARAAHLSRYHFIRSFRAVVFETPHRYIVRKRIDRAKDLLANTDRSVTDICFEVGFDSLGSFSTLFRREVGWAPSMYRARCLEIKRCPQRFIPGCLWNGPRSSALVV